MQFISFIGPQRFVANTDLIKTFPIDVDFSSYLQAPGQLVRVFLSNQSYDQAVFMITDGGIHEGEALELLEEWVPDFEPTAFELAGNSIVLHSDYSGEYDT